MTNSATSYSTSWQYGNNLDQLLNWIGEKGFEGFELKSLTATVAPNTEFDRETGERVNVWEQSYIAVVQKPHQ